MRNTDEMFNEITQMNVHESISLLARLFGLAESDVENGTNRLNAESFFEIAERKLEECQEKKPL